MANLPIDIIPDSKPLKFRWQTRVNTLDNTATQECEGSLPLPVEGAVVMLIALTKQLQHENKELRERLVAAVQQQPVKKSRGS